MRSSPRIYTCIALGLCLTLSCANATRAQSDPRPDFIIKLSESNIRAFYEKTRLVAAGQDPDHVLIDEIANYFLNHIDDAAKFSGTISYDIQGFPKKDVKVEANKQKYIRDLTSGLKFQPVSFEIKDLVIEPSGKSAQLKTLSTEAGMMVMNDAQNKPQRIAVESNSSCEETLIVSWNNFIQTKVASCKTTLRLASAP